MLPIEIFFFLKFHYLNISQVIKLFPLPPSSIPLSHSAFLLHFFPLPPPLPPSPLSVCLSSSGRTIKSFPGLSHPMSRMMRICSLNQNSYLLHPSCRLSSSWFFPRLLLICIILSSFFIHVLSLILFTIIFFPHPFYVSLLLYLSVSCCFLFDQFSSKVLMLIIIFSLLTIFSRPTIYLFIYILLATGPRLPSSY